MPKLKKKETESCSMRTYLKGGRIYLGGVMTENKGFVLEESGIVSMKGHCSEKENTRST